ncbi:MAG: protein phosphatase 2C domain-containing protein [Candidatus Saliniplasma sp.]
MVNNKYIAAESDVGRKRNVDEDSVLVMEHLVGWKQHVHEIYEGERHPKGTEDKQTVLGAIVADGMGGHARGEVASSMAISTIREGIGNKIRNSSYFNDLQNYENQVKKFTGLLAQQISKANEEIFRNAEENPDRQGMGTTITGGLLISPPGKFIAANVGDSRTYIVRKKEGNNYEMEQVTRDHSAVQDLIEEGEIDPEEAEHPRSPKVERLSSQITRALGIGEGVEIDTFVKQVYKGDYILVCCDGLTDMVPEKKIQDAVVKYDTVGKATKELVRLANQYGGDDNISVALIDTSRENIPKKEMIEEGDTQIRR